MCSFTLPLLFLVIQIFIVTNEVASLYVENIVGGNEASINDFPYMAVVSRGNNQYCGAVIIDDNYLLTAAHCVTNENNNILNANVRVAVATGSIFSNFGKVLKTFYIHVKTIYVPKKYIDSAGAVYEGNDIAVLQLTKPLEKTKHKFNVVSLPQTEEDYSYKAANITGYGCEKAKLLEKNGNTYVICEKETGLLRYAEANVLSRKTCLNELELNYDFDDRTGMNIADTLFCAKMKQRSIRIREGICFGDSGGPLVIGREKLIGIASFGPSNCDETSGPGVYTIVTTQLEFINKVRKQHIDNTIIKQTVSL